MPIPRVQFKRRKLYGLIKATSGESAVAEATLAFHAFDGDPFDADVIVGTGVVTEGRTDAIITPDATPVWQSFGSGVPAEYYAGSEWWGLHQPSLTNTLERSVEQANVAWTKWALTTNKNQNGLENLANECTLLTDGDGVNAAYATQNETIANDGNPVTHQWMVKQDSDETRFPQFRLRLSGGTGLNLHFNLNTATGATHITLNTSSAGSVEVNDRGGWWEVLARVTNNSSGNVTAETFVYPAMATVITTGFDGATTGSIVLGNVSLHEGVDIHGVRGTAPIKTTLSAARTTVACGISFDDADHDQDNGAIAIKLRPFFASSEVSGNIEVLSLANGANLMFYDATAEAFKSSDGTNTASAAHALASETAVKVGVAWGDGKLQVNVNGSWGSEGVYDGAFPIGTTLQVLRAGAYPCLFKAIKGYSGGFDNAKASIDAYMAA